MAALTDEPNARVAAASTSDARRAADAAAEANPQLQFGINDPNVGDNGGGPWVRVTQWW